MQGGDIASWGEQRSVVILDGLLCVPTYVQKKRRGPRIPVEVLDEPENWHWSELAIKSLQDKIYRLNAFIDVVTFISPEVAEKAAEYFQRYDISHSSVEYYDYSQFCTSLAWRSDIHSIYEANATRIQRYGQRGIAVQGGRF